MSPKKHIIALKNSENPRLPISTHLYNQSLNTNNSLSERETKRNSIKLSTKTLSRLLIRNSNKLIFLLFKFPGSPKISTRQCLNFTVICKNSPYIARWSSRTDSWVENKKGEWHEHVCFCSDETQNRLS
jgi:hypothetical protein